MDNIEPYLTPEDVARWLGVSLITVYRLAEQGKLPAFKAGHQWRFAKARLQEWVSDQEWQNGHSNPSSRPRQASSESDSSGACP